jgi:hypothetical protein
VKVCPDAAALNRLTVRREVPAGDSHTIRTFSAGTAAAPAMRVDPAGCESVTGLGPVRTLVRRASFWTVLGTAMKLPDPAQGVFFGTLSSGG